MKTLILLLFVATSAWAGTYAKVENGTVTNVIVADPEFIATQPGQWVATTTAAKGYTYDGIAFTPPAPYPSWRKKGRIWRAPVAMPADGQTYLWQENKKAWAAFPWVSPTAP